MASLNRVMIIGNLGADPEVRSLNNGDEVANFRVATTDRWKDKASGEMKEATEWHTVCAFRQDAKFIGEYARKGSQVYVEGSLRTRKWQDKEGVDKYTTEIVASRVQLLGGRREEEPQQSKTQQKRVAVQQGGKPPVQEEDIPY